MQFGVLVEVLFCERLRVVEVLFGELGGGRELDGRVLGGMQFGALGGMHCGGSVLQD